MLFNNKLFNSIACLLSFTNLQLVIPGRTWILLYLGRTVYKRLWACLALYQWWLQGDQGVHNTQCKCHVKLSKGKRDPLRLALLTSRDSILILLGNPDSLIDTCGKHHFRN